MLNINTKLAKAVKEADLETVIALVPDIFNAPKQTVYSTLYWIFKAAQEDKINLLNPPINFHEWLKNPLTNTKKGALTAKPNTIRTRLTLLGALYKYLQNEKIIENNPLYGFERPPMQKKSKYLPLRSEIELLEKKCDSKMEIAILLIGRQAFQTGEILDLQWQDISFHRKSILRRKTETFILNDIFQKIENLYSIEQGTGFVFPWRTDAGLRYALWQLCKSVGCEYFPPSHIRQAALRDFGHILTYKEAGFISPKAYFSALKLTKLE